jgi:hypothetical protein
MTNPAYKPWTKREIKLLGTDTDAAIATRTGRTLTAVTNKRLLLGIPAGFTHELAWTDEEIELLGTMSDIALAEQIGCSRIAVFRKRKSLGIKAWRQIKIRRRRKKTL